MSDQDGTPPFKRAHTDLSKESQQEHVKRETKSKDDSKRSMATTWSVDSRIGCLYESKSKIYMDPYKNEYFKVSEDNSHFEQCHTPPPTAPPPHLLMKVLRESKSDNNSTFGSQDAFGNTAASNDTEIEEDEADDESTRDAEPDTDTKAASSSSASLRSQALPLRSLINSIFSLLTLILGFSQSPVIPSFLHHAVS